MIQVCYHNNTIESIEAWKLDQLINGSQIKSFRRKSGWVVLGEDNVRRGPGVTTTGEERRLSSDEAIKLKQRVAELERELTDFALITAGLAHDCNNFMMAIQGHVELARHKLPASSELGKNFNTIELASRHAASLCKQMVTYVRKETQEALPLDLTQVVEELRLLLSAIIPKKITLDYNLAPSLAAISGDNGLLRQLLMNLTINGCEAIGQDREGAITLSTGSIEIDRGYLSQAYLGQELAPGPYVYLEIADNGCGMARQDLGKFLEPFASSKGKGRGLGLAIVARICQADRAVLTIASEAKQGTTIRISFPAL